MPSICCNQPFESKSQLDEHRKKMHQLSLKVNLSKEISVPITRKLGERFKCVCGKEIAAPKGFQNHAKGCIQFRSRYYHVTSDSLSVTPEQHIPQTTLQSFEIPLARAESAGDEFSVSAGTEAEINNLFLDENVQDNVPGAEPTSSNDTQLNGSSPVSVPIASESDIIEGMSSMQKEDYNLELAHIGIVIHIASGAVICWACSCGVRIKGVYLHLRDEHTSSGSNYFRQNGYTKSNLEELLLEKGALQYGEAMGRYLFPSKESLPRIEVLEFKDGYECGVCPNQNQLHAFYTDDITKIKRHLNETHRGQSTNYIPCNVQSIYDGKNSRRFFKAHIVYTGETVQSTITAEGKSRFERFMERNPDAAVISHKIVRSESSVVDTRTIPNFYRYVPWFDFVKIFTGSDKPEDCILCYHLIHEPLSNANKDLYKAIVDHTAQYFKKIHSMLTTPKYYFWRRKVVATKPHLEPPKGLTALDPATLTRYIKVWTEFIVMLVKVTLADEVRDEKTRRVYQKMRKTIYPIEEKRYIEEYITCIKSRNGDEKDATHSLFTNLVYKYNNRGEAHRSSMGVFTALSQILYTGDWKDVRNVSGTSVALVFCMRLIVLQDIIFDEKEYLREQRLLLEDIQDGSASDTSSGDEMSE